MIYIEILHCLNAQMQAPSMAFKYNKVIYDLFQSSFCSTVGFNEPPISVDTGYTLIAANKVTMPTSNSFGESGYTVRNLKLCTNAVGNVSVTYSVYSE